MQPAAGQLLYLCFITGSRLRVGIAEGYCYSGSALLLPSY
jgi:hypothetical protein